jgi:hypothetical protein
MSTFFILMYIATVISILLGVAGFIMLIYGLAVKAKKLTIYGSIMTAAAIILIISGVFCGAHKMAKCHFNKCQKEIECIREFGPPGGPMCMDMDSMMCKDDSTMSNDSGCVQMKMKCNHMKKMKCMKMKCNPSECKSKCPEKK